MKWESIIRREWYDDRPVVVTYFFLDGVPITEAEYRSGKVPEDFEARRRVAQQERIAQQKKVPMCATAISTAKPLKSDALAIHSSQREKIMARNKRHGINVEYDRQGRPVFTDAGQRKKLCKLEGVRQLNSYYGY